MKKKRINYSLLILLCFLIISFILPGTMVRTSFAADDLSDNSDEMTAGADTDNVRGGSDEEAYAVFDSSDGSLMLFRGETGAYEDGQTMGTKTYY